MEAIKTMDAEVVPVTYGNYEIWQVRVRVNGKATVTAFEGADKLKAEGVRDFFNGRYIEDIARQLAVRGITSELAVH